MVTALGVSLSTSFIFLVLLRYGVGGGLVCYCFLGGRWSASCWSRAAELSGLLLSRWRVILVGGTLPSWTA